MKITADQHASTMRQIDAAESNWVDAHQVNDKRCFVSATLRQFDAGLRTLVGVRQFAARRHRQNHMSWFW